MTEEELLKCFKNLNLKKGDIVIYDPHSGFEPEMMPKHWFKQHGIKVMFVPVMDVNAIKIISFNMEDEGK